MAEQEKAEKKKKKKDDPKVGMACPPLHPLLLVQKDYLTKIPSTNFAVFWSPSYFGTIQKQSNVLSASTFFA
eukprot:4886178-Amphidinium_carterae.1